MICYLGLGSNDGDRELHLQNALNYLAGICREVYPSTPYASPALKGNDNEFKRHYLNCVAMIEYSGDISELDRLLKAFEIREGRDEKSRIEGRVPIDIDIVIADGNILRPKDFSCYFFRRGYEELR